MTRPPGRPRGSSTSGAKPLSKSQIRLLDKSLIGTTHEHRNRALIFLCLGSGLRIGEAVGMSLGVIADPTNWRVRASFVLDRHATKGRKSRRVYLSKQARTYGSGHRNGPQCRNYN
jgi:integrase